MPSLQIQIGEITDGGNESSEQLCYGSHREIVPWLVPNSTKKLSTKKLMADCALDL